MTLSLPEIDALVAEVKLLRAEIAELREKIEPSKAWYRRADLAALKGLKVSAFYQRPWLLPAGGQRIGGVEQWPREEVERWLKLADDDLRAGAGKGRLTTGQGR